MGGESSNKAQRQAEEAEKARQQQINQTTADINRLFDAPGREQQRKDFGQALLAFFTDDANRQKGVADRDLRFAMARSGLTGGSAAVDANRELGEEYSRGILQAGQRAQSAVADMRGQDEQARTNLIGLAQAGLSTGNAATQAAAAMRSSMSGADAAARTHGLGDIFGGVATARQRSEEAAEKRRTNKQFSEMYGPYYARFSGGFG